GLGEGTELLGGVELDIEAAMDEFPDQGRAGVDVARRGHGGEDDASHGRLLAARGAIMSPDGLTRNPLTHVSDCVRAPRSDRRPHVAQPSAAPPPSGPDATRPTPPPPPSGLCAIEVSRRCSPSPVLSSNTIETTA